MKITFLGGAGSVTGSKYLVQTDSTQILVDCGLFQGYKSLRERNWQSLPVDIEKLDAVVLTHAHLDHSGYIPVLHKNGYRKPVFTHYATKDLCSILLPDSGHIQEEDAKYLVKHRLSKHENPQALYTRREAEQSLKLFRGVDFEETFSVGDIQCRLQSAGHILGAASIILEAEGKRIGFSGDVGRPDDVFMRPPSRLPEVDLLILESTYGNRQHERIDPGPQLASIVNETMGNGGVVLIPSFAVGRAQTIMHLLAELMNKEDIARVPIYLDSPMAINVSDIYCRYAGQHRLTQQQCKTMCEDVTYTKSVEESKAISRQAYPHVIIAGSGMATGGRILHHMKRLLGSHNTTVLFTGYQAGGTRGAKMQQGVDSVKIHGKWIPCRAKIEVLHALSGHGDYLDIEQWLADSNLTNKTKIQLVHGDPDALEGMKDYLTRNTDYETSISEHRKSVTI